MPTIAASVPELLALLEGTVRIEGERVVIADEATFRSRAVADLAWTQTFSEDPATVEAARWIIWEASQVLGARSASIQDLAKVAGEQFGPLGELIGGIAGGSVPFSGAPVPVRLDGELEAKDGHVEMVSGTGRVAGIPAGPLAGLVTNAILSRL